MGLSRLLQNLFPLWVLLGAALGYIFPAYFSAGARRIPLALGVVMLGMGITISREEWKKLCYTWKLVGIGIALQYLLMPLLAFLLCSLFRFPTELNLGMILVGSAPGGTASNVITYLARADLPLSIVMTTVSTLLSPILTPFWITILAGQWVPIDPIPLFLSVVEIILIPIILGIGIRSIFTPPPWINDQLLPLLSMAIIAWIVAVIVALNHTQIANLSLLYAAVLLHHGGGLLLGYLMSRTLRVPINPSRTIAIEVGIQNSGLAVALATQHFQPLAALPGALFSLFQNLVGPLVAIYFRNHPPQDR